jgi:hypothetical protein
MSNKSCAVWHLAINKNEQENPIEYSFEQYPFNKIFLAHKIIIFVILL